MTSPEWAAEHDVDPGLAAALVGRQFPFLRGAEVRPLAVGWDNTVYLVAGEWAFRFPRRAVALPGVEREIAVLPRLAGRLPLPVPQPALVGEPSGGYPWPFWGGRLLPGRELAEAGLPDAAREALGAAVGRFLRALHDPGLAAAAGHGLPVDPLRRADPGVRAPMARERLQRLARLGLYRPDPRAAVLLARAEPLGAPAGPPVLAHGDLHVRHLLVDRHGRAAGVIDWGDMCLADPAVDLSLAYGAFTGTGRAALLDAYGRVGADREARARVLALVLGAALGEYAAAERRPRLLREALAVLGRAVS